MWAERGGKKKTNKVCSCWNWMVKRGFLPNEDFPENVYTLFSSCATIKLIKSKLWWKIQAANSRWEVLAKIFHQNIQAREKSSALRVLLVLKSQIITFCALVCAVLCPEQHRPNQIIITDWMTTKRYPGSSTTEAHNFHAKLTLVLAVPFYCFYIMRNTLDRKNYVNFYQLLLSRWQHRKHFLTWNYVQLKNCTKWIVIYRSEF